MSNKKDRSPNDRRSDVKNENNREFLADAKNREKQMTGKDSPQVETAKKPDKR
jgi:hypothetical protein